MSSKNYQHGGGVMTGFVHSLQQHIATMDSPAKLYGFVLVRDQNSEILQNKLWRLGVKEDSECSTFR